MSIIRWDTITRLSFHELGKYFKVDFSKRFLHSKNIVFLVRSEVSLSKTCNVRSEKLCYIYVRQQSQFFIRSADCGQPEK